MILSGFGVDAIHFLISYRFALEEVSAPVWVESWQQNYPTAWIPLGLLEACYQGRFKAASVDQILRSWQRVGSPRIHFDTDFADQFWPDHDWIRLLPQLQGVVAWLQEERGLFIGR